MPDLQQRHEKLLALLDGMEKIEQGATAGPWESDGEAFPYDGRPFSESGAGIHDANYKDICIGGQQDEQGGAVGFLLNEDAALTALSRNALPPLLADLRRRAETHYRYVALSESGELWEQGLAELPPAHVRKHARAHHACCTTALAAAAGTPALAQEVAALKEVLDAG